MAEPRRRPRRTAEENCIDYLDRLERQEPEVYARYIGVHCTTCEAVPGARCTTQSGKVTRWHVPRVVEGNKKWANEP